ANLASSVPNHHRKNRECRIAYPIPVSPNIARARSLNPITVVNTANIEKYANIEAPPFVNCYERSARTGAKSFEDS
ncbi:hypothetical protein CW696_08470, partial [ANME-2 cluster archaeon]